MLRTIYPFVFLLCFAMFVSSCKKSDSKDDPTLIDTVTDIDGNLYHTVTIGTQVWMVENLKTTKYRNGDPIPNVTGNSAWGLQENGSYCWYNNDPSTNKSTYGALYNWYAINDVRGMAPFGWHIPIEDEWNTLIAFAGGEVIGAAKLKESGTTHWLGAVNGTTNICGFTALPGGCRTVNGTFDYIGYSGCWWSTMEYYAASGWYRKMHSYDSNFERNFGYKVSGFSVRCIKD